MLDVACGCGRHTRAGSSPAGHPVVAVDRDLSARRRPRRRRLGASWSRPTWSPRAPPTFRPSSPAGEFGGVVVTNYLWRPLLGALVAAVAPGGALIYETFARGNERIGHPRNPDFLLEPGELLDAVRGELRVVAYEDVVVDAPRPAAVQRIAAVRAATEPNG